MKIRTKVVIGFCLLALFAVFLTGYFTYQTSRESLTQQGTSFLHSINEQKAERVKDWLTSTAEVLAVLAKLPIMTENPDMYAIGETQGKVAEVDSLLQIVTEKYLKTALESGRFNEFFLLAVPEGELIASTDSTHVGKIMEERQFFKEGQKYTYFESVFYSITLMQPTMVVATPIRDSKGTTIAVLAGRFDLERVSEIMRKQRSHWQTEDSYLVNNQNFFITEPRYGENYMLRKTVFTEGVMKGFADKHGISWYRDYRGEPIIGGYLYLEEFNLVQLTEIDQQEFLQPIKTIQRNIATVALLVLLLFIVVGIAFMEFTLRPLAMLVERVLGISSQELTFKDDRSLPYEIGRLSSAFAATLDRLRETLVSRDELQREVEQRKRVEEQLKEVLVDIQRSNEELEQFAYVASHDLQEPLRMVSSYNQLLAKQYKGKLDEKADKYIYYAVDGAMRMQRLIQDLLSYSRVTTKGNEFEKVDCHEALAEAITNLEVLIEETSAVVTTEDLPVVLGDHMQVVQLFQNLLNNSIKFRKPETLPAIHIGAQQSNEVWQIALQDNGIGIDPKYQDRIFVIFKRLHTREEYSGTGIGLALCKRIVERHGGKIWFESEPDKGTTFYFILPQYVGD